MAKIMFTVEDVKEFLSQNNLDWTGYVYNANSFSKKLASNKDLEQSMLAFEIENKHRRNSLTDVLINHFSFVTYTDCSMFIDNGSFPCVDRNLSKKWQKFLLNKYQFDYAELLLAWSTNNMLIIKSQIDEEDCSLRDNQHLETRLEEFVKSAKLAKEFLKPSLTK